MTDRSWFFCFVLFLFFSSQADISLNDFITNRNWRKLSWAKYFHVYIIWRVELINRGLQFYLCSDLSAVLRRCIHGQSVLISHTRAVTWKTQIAAVAVKAKIAFSQEPSQLLKEYRSLFAAECKKSLRDYS